MRFQGLMYGFLAAITSLIAGCSNSPDLTNNNFTGTWQVIAIHNSSPSGPTLGPNTDEVIAINFMMNGNYSGTTSANSFNGEYDATNEKLIVKTMTTTEVADTNYGQAFYETFNDSRNTKTNFSEYTIELKDNNTMDLKYQSFKFLTLQKQ